MASRPRILTGDRPTGKMHLGHYVGTLANRARLQDEYECFFLVADLHMLTTRTELERLRQTGQNIRDVVLDNLSYLFRAAQNGLVQQYALAMLIGLFLLFASGGLVLGLY